MAGRGYRIEISVNHPMPGVRADQEALSRALWNLLDNAVKYSPHCQTIWVEADGEGDEVEIRVRDQGVGVAPGEQQQIFKKFVRGGSAQAAGAKGTGLGLTMVRHIVAAHGGQVRVESQPDVGSTFTILLPAARGYCRGTPIGCCDPATALCFDLRGNGRAGLSESANQSPSEEMSRHVLDELFDEAVYHQLRAWGISVDKVGVGFGQLGWLDERLLSALHGSGRTFHTRNQGYYKRRYCHSSCCLVYYEVPAPETASYIRRLLRHSLFNTHAKRLGKVIKVTPRRTEFWKVRAAKKERAEW